jgi:hypothetical protein
MRASKFQELAFSLSCVKHKRYASEELSLATNFIIFTHDTKEVVFFFV